MKTYNYKYEIVTFDNDTHIISLFDDVRIYYGDKIVENFTKFSHTILDVQYKPLNVPYTFVDKQ